MMIQMKQQQSMMIMFGLFMGMVVVGYVKVVEFIATKCLGYYGWDDNNNHCPSRKDHHGVEEEEEERKRMMGWDEYMLRFLLPKKRVLVAENNNNRKVVVLDKKTMLFQSPPPLPVAHVAAARGGKGKSVVTQRCMCILLHTSSV